MALSKIMNSQLLSVRFTRVGQVVSRQIAEEIEGDTKIYLADMVLDRMARAGLLPDGETSWPQGHA